MDPILVELELQKDQIGTFFCFVKNNVGKSSPCQVQVDFQNLGQ